MAALTLAVIESVAERWVVTGAHLGTSALIVALGITRWLHPAWLVLPSAVLIVADMHHAPSLDTPLAFGTTWFWNLIVITAAFISPGRLGVLVPLILAFTVPVALTLDHPSWGLEFPVAAGVTGVAITVAVGLGLQALRTFAARADEQSRDAALRQQAVAVARAARHAAAESARTLHDTVINTLGAIANGLGPHRRPGPVRRRCADDARTARSLIASGSGVRVPPLRWDDLESVTGITLRRSGLARADSEAVIEELPGPVREAVVGALGEVLRNVAKHAQVSDAELHVTSEAGVLTISVRDHGIGFSGRPVGGFGLAESVIARCEDVGVDATIESRLGAGTVVTLRHQPEGPSEVAADNVDFARVTEHVRVRAQWLWSSGVIGVGVAIESINRFGHLSWTWAGLALLAATSALAWLGHGRRGALGGGIQFVLVLAAPASWWFFLAGVEFGERDVELWQALGVTAPVSILVFSSTPPRTVGAAVAAFVVTGLGTAVAMQQSGSAYVGVVVIGIIVPSAVIVAVVAFNALIGRIGARAAADQSAALSARVELARFRATHSARERWQAAGIEASIRLLEQIANGSADPTSTTVQTRCAIEERYLRGLLLLSTDLVKMGPWLARAMARARARGVVLTVRSGAYDTPDRAVSAYAGRLVLASVDVTPDAESLVVGLFRRPGGGGCLTIVGSSSSLTADLVPRTAPEECTTSHDTYGRQSLIEVSWEAP